MSPQEGVHCQWGAYVTATLQLLPPSNPTLFINLNMQILSKHISIPGYKVSGKSMKLWTSKMVSARAAAYRLAKLLAKRSAVTPIGTPPDSKNLIEPKVLNQSERMKEPKKD
eukprot:1001914-Pelagomonas_calceolata.AAC.3